VSLASGRKEKVLAKWRAPLDVQGVVVAAIGPQLAHGADARLSSAARFSHTHQTGQTKAASRWPELSFTCAKLELL